MSELRRYGWLGRKTQNRGLTWLLPPRRETKAAGSSAGGPGFQSKSAGAAREAGASGSLPPGPWLLQRRPGCVCRALPPSRAVEPDALKAMPPQAPTESSAPAYGPSHTSTLPRHLAGSSELTLLSVPLASLICRPSQFLRPEAGSQLPPRRQPHHQQAVRAASRLSVLLLVPSLARAHLVLSPGPHRSLLTGSTLLAQSLPPTPELFSTSDQRTHFTSQLT